MHAATRRMRHVVVHMLARMHTHRHESHTYMLIHGLSVGNCKLYTYTGTHSHRHTQAHTHMCDLCCDVCARMRET